MTLKFKIAFEVTAKFLKSKKLTAKVALPIVEKKIGEGYWSIDHGEWGFGQCPHVAYRVTISVIGWDGKPVEGSEVFMVLRGDNEVSPIGKTNGDGIVVAYIESGTQTFLSMLDGEMMRLQETVGSARKVFFNWKNQTADSIPDWSGRGVGFADFGEAVDSGVCGADGDNLTWNLYQEGILVIFGTGPMKDYSFDEPAPWSGTPIERLVIENDVSSIGKYAFQGCSSLASVVFADDSVCESIGDYAFQACESLTSVNAPDSVTNIGKYAFSGCTNLIDMTIPTGVSLISDSAFYGCESLTSVTLPDTVIRIGDQAFAACTNLSNVYLPESVIRIGISAFYGCSSLADINIPSGVTVIDHGTFAYCQSLTELSLHENVSHIEPFAFAYCESLTSITIPQQVRSISQGVFQGCTNLRSIAIPENVSVICDSALDSCVSLQYISFGGTRAQWDSIAKETNWDNNTGDYTVEYLGEHFYSYGLEYTLSDDSTYYIVSGVGVCADNNLRIPASYNGLPVKEISDAVFCDCDDLLAVTIPAGVTSIGAYAFYDCNSLINVTIPDSMISIGQEAFSYCTDLTSITIPDGVTGIGNYAFFGCASLSIITFEGDAPAFGDIVFGGVTATAYYPADNATWTADVMQNAGSNITWVSESLKYTLSEDGTYYIVSGIGTYPDTDVIIPHTYRGLPVKEIGNRSFYYCRNLTSVTIPDSVTTIGAYAFSWCGSLTNITIGNGVTGIGQCAFDYCRNLTSVIIPDSVTSIGDSVFEGCERLASITIGKGVNSIGDRVFCGCFELADIQVAAGNECYCDVDGVLYSKDMSLLHSYPAAKKTKTFAIPDSVTGIGNYAFRHSNITGITIPASVTSMGQEAFSWCASLTNITFESDAPMYGYNAFEYVTATAYYPAGNDSWTSDVMLRYGGAITWMAYCTGHIWMPATCTEPQTCTICGATEGEAMGHSWQPATCTEPRTCTICGATEGEAMGHSWQPATCTEPQTCTICGATEGDVRGHTWDVPFDGSAWICSVCGIIGCIGPDHKFEKISDLAAIVEAGFVVSEDTIEKAATCATDGYHYGQCKYCGAIDKIIDEALGHLYDDREDPLRREASHISNSYDYYLCERCGAEIKVGNEQAWEGLNKTWETLEEALAAHGTLTYKGVLVVGSCTTVGRLRYICDNPNCKAVYVLVRQQQPLTDTNGDGVLDESDIQYPTGEHAMPEGTEYQAPTCTEPGFVDTYKCLRCQNFIGNAPVGEPNYIEATGHSYIDGRCTACGEKKPNDGLNCTYIDQTGSDTLTPNSIYDGDMTVGDVNGVTTRTASFSELVPGRSYVLLVLASLDVEDYLAAPNLLFIDQGVANAEGNLTFTYVLAEDVGISYVMACGASDKDLADAEITFPTMLAGEEPRAVAPVVTYQGKVLTEGKDYVLLGRTDYTTSGKYTCFIRGIRDYTGLVECQYMVYADQNMICYGDVNGDGEINGRDVIQLRKYMANFDYDTGLSTVEVSAGVDVNGDGQINGRDVILLRKYMANYDYDTGESTVVLGPQ